MKFKNFYSTTQTSQKPSYFHETNKKIEKLHIVPIDDFEGVNPPDSALTTRAIPKQ